MRRLLLPLILLATPLAAQDASPRLGFELGADVSYWQLNPGYAADGSSTAPSGTVRAALVVVNRRPTSVGAALGYAREDGPSPGLLAVTGEITQRLFAPTESGFNLFLTAGLGGLRFLAQAPVGVDDCHPDNGCIDETPAYDEHWRTVATGAVGADVPLRRDLMLQPTFTLVQPVREREDRPAQETMYRFGIGMAWRL